MNVNETERALRADILGAVARGWCSPNNSAKVMDADLAEAITIELLPLFNAGMAQAKLEEREKNSAAFALMELTHVAAMAGAYAAAAESFIKAQEEWHKTSGIPATRERGCNCYGDDKTNSHASGCPRRIAAKILALTPADARHAHHAAIASAEARARLDEHVNGCAHCMLATPVNYCHRGQRLHNAAHSVAPPKRFEMAADVYTCTFKCNEHVFLGEVRIPVDAGFKPGDRVRLVIEEVHEKSQ